MGERVIKTISLQKMLVTIYYTEIHILNALDEISNFPFSLGAIYGWPPDTLIVATIMQLNK